MKKLGLIAFLLMGVINSIFAGIVFRLIMSSGWNTHLVMLVFVTSVSAVLLMRAPFSRKNIDSFFVDSMRSIVAAVFCYIQLKMLYLILVEGCDTDLILVIIINTITIGLIVFMPTIRPRFFVQRD